MRRPMVPSAPVKKMEPVSERGKRLYFPKGILTQSAEAKAKGKRFNATIGIATEGQGPVTIMADQDNNAILIMASPADYRMIEAAIRQLDIQPRQVLINAIISEVTLNDELDYGVGWFLSDERWRHTPDHET